MFSRSHTTDSSTARSAPSAQATALTESSSAAYCWAAESSTWAVRIMRPKCSSAVPFSAPGTQASSAIEHPRWRALAG